MGMALAILFLVCILFIAISQRNEESAAIASQTRKLPDGAHMFFDQRISGHSRKGVVTYYSHFVRAVYRSPNGITQQETFPFDHHDLNDKAAAWGRAHSWVIDAHKTSASDVKKQERQTPGITTLEQFKERLGTPRSISNTTDGQIAVVWAGPKADVSKKGITILFTKDGTMIRIVKKNET